MGTQPESGDIIAVWFSCGVASAVAAKLAIELYPRCDVRVVNNPVKEEHEDNLRFLSDVEAWLGVPIESAVNPDFQSCSAVDVWAKRRFMSGPHGAPCTIELKKKAREHWEQTNNPDWHVLGFTADEQKRAERFQKGERQNMIPVLVNERMTKRDCFLFLSESGIKPPEIYSLGYPNANCIGCVKATSPTYWNLVRREHPDVFEQRAKQSRELGVRLVRVENERIFLDELPEDAKGASLKNMQFDCGIFCEGWV